MTIQPDSSFVRNPREEERRSQLTDGQVDPPVPAPRPSRPASRLPKRQQLPEAVDFSELNLGADPNATPTPTGVPYEDWEKNLSYISAEESDPNREDDMVENRVKIEMDKARRVGRPISKAEARRRVGIQGTGVQINPSSGDAYVSIDAIKSQQPSSMVELRQYIATQYPTVSAAAQISGLSEEEFALSTNFLAAHDAASRVIATQNPVRQAQIINTAGPDIQPIIYDIFQNWYERGTEARTVVQDESGGNTATDFGKTVFGYTVAPIFDGLWWANETVVQRSIPTLIYWLGAKQAGEDVSIQDVFNMTEKGYIDPEGISYARSQFGAKPVDIAVEFLQAHRRGEPDSIGLIIKKYENDPEALSIIDQMLSGTMSNDPNIRNAIKFTESMELGNFGNMIFWLGAATAGIDPFSDEGVELVNTVLYTGVKDVSNILGSFVFDPTLGLSKASGAYRMGRYGIGRLASPGGLDRAFKSKSVLTLWDSFGGSLKYIDEAPDTVVAAQRANSVQSSYSKWFTPSAINEFRKAKIYTADDALNYFKGADDLGLMISGQKASRYVEIPHMMMATAQTKRASLVARGWTYDRNASAKIDDMFGAPVSKMVPEEATPFILEFLSKENGSKFLGRMMSNFVYAGDTAKRTFMGQFVSSVIKIHGNDTPRVQAFKQAMLRYGFKRESGLRARGERLGRTMSHMPNLSSISLTSGKDAGKIRDLLLYGGMPRYWANYASFVWKEMLPSQRIQFASGIGRSVGYALGIDIVDPVNGRRVIDNLMTGLRPGELYAPDMQDLTSIAGQAERNTKGALAANEEIQNLNSQVQKLVKEKNSLLRGEQTALKKQQIDAIDNKVKELKDSIKNQRKNSWMTEFNSLKENAPIVNQSQVQRGLNPESLATKGLYEFQMSDQISIVNFDKLDQLAMRQSYFTALLGVNPFMTRAVDFWVIGTLAGPRFQIRNGIEDAVLFGTTGGSWKNYRYGQLFARAKAEATARPVDRRAVSRAEKEGTLTSADLGPARGQQLGLVPTTTRWLGDKVPKALNALILRHLDESEIAAAATLGAKGDRTALNVLIMKAFMRQKLIFLRRPKNKTVISDLDDAVDFGGFSSTYDESSEASMHLIDGVLPGSDNIQTAIINGNRVQVHTIGREFMSKKVYGSDPDRIRGWYNNLTMILEGDGIKGPKAVSMITRYHAAKRSGNNDGVNSLVKEYTDWLEKNAPWVSQKSGIAATEGLESFARRNLEDVLRVFSTQTGGLNRELLKKVRRVDVDDVTGVKTFTYKMWDEVDGKIVPRVLEDDLVQMKGRPQSVLDSEGIQIPITDGMPLNTRIWSAMGRSYARLTRQPMFIANYLDARNAIRPLERKMADEFGDVVARKWATETATQRAFDNLVSYVDNPAIRSQLAWNVRNVARFYRAIEDFNRRMLRVTKNNPDAFQKINIGWHVLDDTGFVHEDEYGEKYFIWPGSRVAMQAVNSLVNLITGSDVTVPNIPMMFTSNVNMLTPSADPNSWWPTFSSPYASIGIMPLMEIVPGLGSLKEELFGEYSSDRTIWQSVLPVNLFRPFELLSSLRVGENVRMEMQDGMYASAARSAVQAYAAAGLFDPSKSYTQSEVSKMRSHIDIMAIDIMALKTILGPIIPAAFAIEADTVSDFGRSVGASGMRQVFIQLIKAYEGDMDQAYLTWVKMNPGKSIFTVSTNKVGDNMGNYQPFKETVKFIDENQKLIDEYPIGAAFFAPQEGTSNLSAWNYLKAMGAKTGKSTDQYFNEVVTSQGWAMYQILKRQYEYQVSEGKKDEVQPKWDSALRKLKLQYPLLEDRITGSLRSYGSTSKREYKDVVEEYRGAVNWMEENNNLDSRGVDAKTVLGLYDELSVRLSEMSESDPAYAKHRAELRGKWINLYSRAIERHPNDQQFESFMFTMSSSLGFKVQ